MVSKIWLSHSCFFRWILLVISMSISVLSTVILASVRSCKTSNKRNWLFSKIYTTLWNFREKSIKLGVEIDASPAHLTQDPRFSQVLIGGGVFRSRFYPSAISHFSENTFSRHFSTYQTNSLKLFYIGYLICWWNLIWDRFLGPFLYVGGSCNVRYCQLDFHKYLALTSNHLRLIINSSRSTIVGSFFSNTS